MDVFTSLPVGLCFRAEILPDTFLSKFCIAYGGSHLRDGPQGPDIHPFVSGVLCVTPDTNCIRSALCDQLNVHVA